MELAGGYDLRVAVEADVEQVADLLGERGDAADAVDLRLVVEDPSEGLESCLVVAHGERIVSTATLLKETVRIGGVDVPAGQVELVATASDHEGRGLVRALIDEAHRRSAARGDLLQVMIGIPYFYRQFGYSYAMPIPVLRQLRPNAAVRDPAITVREATHHDIAAMRRLQDETQAGADVAMAHSAACWRWLIDRDGSIQWVAERDSRVIATCRVTPPGERSRRRRARRIGRRRGSTRGRRRRDRIDDRAGTSARRRPRHDRRPCRPPRRSRRRCTSGTTPASSTSARCSTGSPRYSLARAESAGLLDRPHDVLLSSFRSHVRFTIGPDGMSPVLIGGTEQAPTSKGGSGIPPDALAPLLLGPHGALGLEAALPDVMLGRQRDLMSLAVPANARRPAHLLPPRLTTPTRDCSVPSDRGVRRGPANLTSASMPLGRVQPDRASVVRCRR